MSTIENAPALELDKVLYKDNPMPVHVRRERRIVWNLLLALEAKGFVSHSVDDGDEQTKTRTKKAALEILFNLDDALLYLSHKYDNGRLRTVWVRFVFGNDMDVISDYNATNWRGFEDAMGNFNPEDYA